MLKSVMLSFQLLYSFKTSFNLCVSILPSSIPKLIESLYTTFFFVWSILAINVIYSLFLLTRVTTIYPSSSALFSKIFFNRLVFLFSIFVSNLVIFLEKTNSNASKKVVFPNPLGPVKITGVFSSSNENS